MDSNALFQFSDLLTFRSASKCRPAAPSSELWLSLTDFVDFSMSSSASKPRREGSKLASTSNSLSSLVNSLEEDFEL
ncbi:hypothetical protein D3C78_1637800 [compost metagenome]